MPKLGPKAFEQCAGFLRVHGSNPLDATAVHPESYPAAKALLERLGYDLKDLKRGGIAGIAEKVERVGAKTLSAELGVGEMTLCDIARELEKPGRDPREDLPAPVLRSDVLDMNDLKPGMELTGTVRNVIDFGAFVDIGVHQDGLVHISSLSNKFVEDPHTVVKAGDIVKVKVLEVDLQRKRIALTMRLDEQPGETNARRGGGNERPQNNRPAAKPRGREAQPAGNSAMMDALAAAMGKKR